jgi:hypothetical protein
LGWRASDTANCNVEIPAENLMGGRKVFLIAANLEKVDYGYKQCP